MEPPCVVVSRPSRRLAGDDGATLVEYALIVAVVVVASLGAIQFVTNASSDELADRGGRIGAPDVDATGATTTTAAPPPPPPSTATTIPAAVQATLTETACSWADNRGNTWTAGFTFFVTDDTTGGAAPTSTVTGVFRVVAVNGSSRTTAAVSDETDSNGQAAFTLQNLRYLSSNVRESDEVLVEFVVNAVNGTPTAVTVPLLPITFTVDRAGPSGDQC